MHHHQRRRRDDDDDDDDSSSSVDGSDAGDDEARHDARGKTPMRPTPVAAPPVQWSHPMPMRVLHDPALVGDRCRLPPSVLESILAAAGSDPLPSPLLFELRSEQTSIRVFGSVREFTAPSDSVAVGPLLLESLAIPIDHAASVNSMDVDDEVDAIVMEHGDEAGGTDNSKRLVQTVSVRLVSLPKCEYLKIAPLESSYLTIPDIRATLEAHLRRTRSVISQGDTLTISTHAKQKQLQHRFLITEIKPESSCNCIDVDVNLDVVPLDETIATEAVRKKFFGDAGNAAAITDASSVPSSSSSSTTIGMLASATEAISGVIDFNLGALAGNGGDLSAEHSGTVAPESYIYYRVRLTEKTRNLIVSLTPSAQTEEDADLFISTVVERPSLIDNNFMNIETGVSTIHMLVEGDISDIPFIYIAVRGYSAPKCSYVLNIKTSSTAPPPQQPPGSMPSFTTEDSSPPVGDDLEKCGNCLTWVPKRSSAMHQAVCYRNNALCKICKDTGRPGAVMKKADIERHWHCDECWQVGDINIKDKHKQMCHTPHDCTCGVTLPIPLLAPHRLSKCPDRLITCRYCRLTTRAGPLSTSAKDFLIPGPPHTEHESECGARTIQCIKCSSIVQLKDVATHSKIHEMQRITQKRPLVCTNNACGNMQDPKFLNDLALCQSCYKPFWSPRHDPGNQKLVAKIVGAYHSQLTVGCNRPHCANKYCATSTDTSVLSSPMDPTDAALTALTLLKKCSLYNPKSQAVYHLCVADPASSRRRVMAERLVAAGFDVAWCLRAVLEVGEDKAVNWLIANAPKLAEVASAVSSPSKTMKQ